MERSRYAPLIVVTIVVLISLGFAVGGTAVGFVAGGLVLAALVLLVARDRPVERIGRRRPPASAPTLAVAIAPIEDARAAEEIAKLAGSHARGSEPRVLALAPVEPTAAQRWLSLRGTTRQDAQRKLDGAKHALRRAGVEADGEIVDEDPTQAVEDQAAVHGVTAIAFVVPPGKCAEEIEEIRSRTDREVRVIEVRTGE